MCSPWFFPFNFIISSHFPHVSGKEGKISFGFMRKRKWLFSKWAQNSHLHPMCVCNESFRDVVKYVNFLHFVKPKKLRAKIFSSWHFSHKFQYIQWSIMGVMTVHMVNNFNLIFIAKTTIMFETIFFSLVFTNGYSLCKCISHSYCMCSILIHNLSALKSKKLLASRVHSNVREINTPQQLHTSPIRHFSGQYKWTPTAII